MRTPYLKLLLSALCLYLPAMVIAQHKKPVLKVDINISSRQAAEVNEFGYLPWPVKAGPKDKLNVKGLKFTIAKKGMAGTGLVSDYYKTGVQSPHYARLASDGLLVKDGNAGAAIEMRISGLPAGQHTLLTFHNIIGGGGAEIYAPMAIYLNGKLEVAKLTPSYRVLDNVKISTAYLRFNAEQGKDVVLLFKADKGSSAANKNLIFNGFELNTPDVADLAHSPLPIHNDEHVDVYAGTLPLHWTGAKTAVSQDLYFGTDSSAVASANHQSPEFKGNQKTSAYTSKNIYSMLRYYWRVDGINATGKVTKGNIWHFRPRQLAFASAEGYGRFARGGRGGKVVEVTNLNDSGPGSLREAVNTDIGPRTIVFAVSGIITLKSRLVVNQRYVTIAGQTAPGKGICIRSAPLGIAADDAIIRHLRVRLGGGTTYDGMGITGADHSILDHCSISWTIDESFSSRGAHNITLQRTLISEALNIAGHSKYESGKSHGFAASVGGDVGSFHHNLLAHCAGRNWSLAGGADGDGNYLGRMDMRNNVVYNWDHRTTDGGAMEVNFVNNYYKPGAATNFKFALNAQHENYGGGMQRYFFKGNVMEGVFNEQNQEAGRKESGKKVNYQTFVEKPFFLPHVRTQSAGDAYKDVLSDVGCNQPVFDDHDIRIVNETLTGTYTYKGSKSGKPGLPDSQEDVGGWEDYPEVHRAVSFDSDHDGLPDWWEKLHQLNPHSATGNYDDTNADKDKDGFTNLDQYLEWMAGPHFEVATGKTITIDLKQLSRGYIDKPVYQTSDVVNGEIKLTAQGSATFSPDHSGLASFKFTVTDAAGSTFTRSVNIRVI